MTTKQQLADMLEMNEGTFISGSSIARDLGITRAAVWKNIQQLQKAGYEIEAVTNRGYRLGGTNDVLSENSIRKYLGEYAGLFRLEVLPGVTSTNQVLKERAGQLPGWSAVIAGSQTAGRGRRTRSFYSPAHSGIYLSLLLRLPLEAEAATGLTTAAAVAACRAVEACTDAKPEIKWVNDVYVQGRKICGILTEASISMESGGLDWAVMGIGFNVYEPEEGFPEEIASIAGAIAPSRQKDLRSRITAAFMKEYYELCRNLHDSALVQEYRKRSFLIGRSIEVLRGDRAIPAVAEDIDEACHLIVRYEDGSREILSSGEVSVKAMSGQNGSTPETGK